MSPTFAPWLAALLPRAENLPSLPGAALEVLRLCRAENGTLEALATAIARDPALAARLLRFANSSLYGPSEEVKSVQRATLVLGMKTVQLMALSFSLVSIVPAEGQAGAFDYARFWRRSLVRSVAARALAGRVGSTAQDEAFLAGLLGEIGSVVLARCAPEAYARVLEDARTRARGWPTPEAEREHLGASQAEVGEAVLLAWQIPRAITVAVRHAAAPEALPAGEAPELATLVRVLACAGPVTDLLTLDAGAPALRAAMELAERHLGLPGAALSALLDELAAPLEEAARLLELRLPAGRSHEAVLEEARARVLGLSLGQARELESLRIVSDPEQRTQLLAEPGALDPLTGLAAAPACARFLEHQLFARRTGNLTRPLGLVLLELDGFERLPDEEARTEAQRAAAGLLTRVLRRNDLAARLEAGRFALVLGDATPFGLRALGERLRSEAAALELVLASGRLRPSLSLGGACLASSRSSQDGPALRAVVERLLTRAREKGPGGMEIHAQPLAPGG